MKLYFDSNILITLVEGDGDTRAALEAIVYRPNESLEIFISDLSAAEVFVGPLKEAGMPSLADSEFFVAYLGFFERSSPFRRIPIGVPLLIAAARLRAERQGLKTPDAVHLATAQVAGCDVFVTNDRDLRSIASRKGFSICSLELADLESLLARLSSAP